jgi:mannose-6-phosphate isomerase-like protein (cupin superfamily)
MKLAAGLALKKLQESNQLFIELFAHGTLTVEVYKPNLKDHQQPHAKDEIYVVISGHGNFFNDGKLISFTAGDLLFVLAGVEHRFIDFSDDFSTWVIFYGPQGGEANLKK